MKNECSHLVALVANTSWYVFNFRSNLIRKLIDHGYRITVVAPVDEYTTKLKKIGCKYEPVNIDNNGKNPVKDLRTLYDFYRIYSKISPSAIFHFTPKPNIYGTVAASLLRIPVVNNIAGLGTAFVKKNLVNFAAIFLYKLSQNLAYKIFFQNPDDLNLFIRSGIARPDKIDLLPGSGVDLQRFLPRKKDPAQEFRFLLFGRLLWEKGIKEYLEAAKNIKKNHEDVEFQLLGLVEKNNSRSVSEKQLLAWEQRGYITWLGNAEDVRPYIANADCVVLPTYYKEGTPRSLLEAASMEKPIITTDVAGCRQVVMDGVNGFLCRPQDTPDLTFAFEKMLRLTDEQRMLMGRRGREKMIREFDERRVIDKYLGAIRELKELGHDF